MDIASIGGIEYAWRTAGPETGTPVLLIHGYTGNLRNWALTVPALTAAGYRTLSVDNPGHGDSSAPRRFEPYELRSVARDLHELANALGFCPGLVIGHSMGAAIAEEYAIAQREHVRGLVLVGSAGGASGPEREDLSEDMEALRAARDEGGMEAVFDLLVAHGKRPQAAETTAERRALLRREFARTSFEGFEFGALALRTRRDTLNDLATLTCPVLVVRGEDEAPVLVKVSDDLAETIPGARAEVIGGAGHSPQFETPETFNALLLDFLQGIH